MTEGGSKQYNTDEDTLRVPQAHLKPHTLLPKSVNDSQTTYWVILVYSKV